MAEQNFFEEEEFTTQFNGEVIKRILEQALPYKKHLFGFIFFIGIVACLDGTFTYITKLIIDDGILANDLNHTQNLLMLYAALSLIQIVSVFGFIYAAGNLGERIQYDLRRKTFNHLQQLSLPYFDRTPIGWIMSRVTSDSGKIAELVTWGLLDVTWAVLNIITAITFMMIINWQLAIVVMVTLPILIQIAFFFKRKILVEFRIVRKLNSKVTGAFNENISGVRVVKALTRERRNLQEFDQLTTTMYQSGYRAAWLSAMFLPAVQIVGATALGIVVWYGGWQVEIGGLTIGGLQAFITYLTLMLFPIQDLARVYAHMQNSVASAERIFSMIDAEPEILDRPDARQAGTLVGAVEFDKVNFYYDEAKPVLPNFNLKVEPGEMIALVGPTGGGKSSIVNLLYRFYEPKAGTVRFDGTDYTEFTMDSIQSQIGMVLQTPHLFSGTIRENIRYGRLDATDEQIEQAAKVAHAFTFIDEFENGYDEEVGEGGSRLSTGQKQLVSIARAVLTDPRIMIMDEATSSVDTLTEAQIQKGMTALLEGRTSFVIAHRLSTIKRADRILVIEEGCIKEMGSHQELIRAKGHYYSLYTKQFQSADDTIEQVVSAQPSLGLAGV
ncbi:ABC transporter ATP-binding protein [Anaerolineales bacterium HSG25]|nr:ABC transporter ATP-binding protein [Anaerolineales bacterium HSG25]